jgi:hypothetical protein
MKSRVFYYFLKRGIFMHKKFFKLFFFVSSFFLLLLKDTPIFAAKNLQKGNPYHEEQKLSDNKDLKNHQRASSEKVELEKRLIYLKQLSSDLKGKSSGDEALIDAQKIDLTSKIDKAVERITNLINEGRQEEAFSAYKEIKEFLDSKASSDFTILIGTILVGGLGVLIYFLSNKKHNMRGKFIF